MDLEILLRMSDLELAKLQAALAAVLLSRSNEPKVTPKHGGGGGP